jgi:amidase
MAGADPRDPWWVPVPFHGPELNNRKVAFTKASHGYPMHPDISAGLDSAAAKLTDAGYEVIETEVPSVLPAAKGWFSVAMRELKDMLDPIAQQIGSEKIQRILTYYYDMAETVDHQGYMLGIAERTRLVREWTVFLHDYPLVLTPFLMRPTYDYDHDETFAGAKDLFDAALYSYAINYMGLPAGNVPLGMVEGRPAGLQIVGQRFREDLILDALEAIEARSEFLPPRCW